VPVGRRRLRLLACASGGAAVAAHGAADAADAALGPQEPVDAADAAHAVGVARAATLGVTVAADANAAAVFPR